MKGQIASVRPRTDGIGASQFKGWIMICSHQPWVCSDARIQRLCQCKRGVRGRGIRVVDQIDEANVSEPSPTTMTQLEALANSAAALHHNAPGRRITAVKGVFQTGRSYLKRNASHHPKGDPVSLLCVASCLLCSSKRTDKWEIVKRE